MAACDASGTGRKYKNEKNGLTTIGKTAMKNSLAFPIQMKVGVNGGFGTRVSCDCERKPRSGARNNPADHGSRVAHSDGNDGNSSMGIFYQHGSVSSWAKADGRF